MQMICKSAIIALASAVLPPLCPNVRAHLGQYEYRPTATGAYAGNKNDGNKQQTKVVIPTESFSVIEYEIDGKPAIGTVNTALKDFSHKDVYSWYLSIIIDFDKYQENGMPTSEEYKVVLLFADLLDDKLRNDDDAPNALFVAREIRNGFCHLIYYVKDPDTAYAFLKKMIEEKSYMRKLEFIMEQDSDWEQAEWFLNGPGDDGK